MNLATWLHATARRNPDAPAIHAGTRLHASYGDLAARARAIAAGLGVAPGDRVAIFLPNCPEYLELLYGIWWAGAVAVPVNARLHPSELGWILADSGARLVFGAIEAGYLPEGCRAILPGGPEHDALRRCDHGTALPHPREDGDLAWLFYTSGTTGRPKGVMLSHGNLRAMSLSYAMDVDAPAVGQTMLYAAPMSHGAGIYNMIFVRLGARHVVPASGRFDPAEIEALAAHFGDVVMFAAPTMVRRMTAHARQTGYRGEGLRTVIFGGGPMYAEDLDEALAQFGPRFAQIYGQGETPMTITALGRSTLAEAHAAGHASRLSSVGSAMSVIDLRLVDAAGKDCPPRQPGEVLVRGDTVMRGYWNNPGATATAIVDGWLYTGDIGWMDEDGFLTLTDRARDLIISGGSNVYPREVEEVLARHPEVDHVAVVGVPDREWGEVVVAVAVPRAQPPSANDLVQWCRSHLAGYKAPRHVLFREALPTNNYGKVLKSELRVWAAGLVGGG